MGRIFVVGSLNMDLVGYAPRIPSAGETIIGTNYLQCPGGKGANQAYAAARLGGDVAMIGCVGDDANGAALRDQLESTGCDTSRLYTVSDPTGVALITVADSGENIIVVIGGANTCLTPETVRAALADARIGVGDLLLSQLETPIETVIAAAALARDSGATVILDPAPAPGPLPAALTRLVSVLTPNASEAALLTGETLSDLSVQGAQALGWRLRAQTRGTVIVKLGALGCVIIDDQGERHVPAPQVRAVDSTAAGDVFNGALAIALSEGRDMTEACAFAVRAASCSVTRAGAQSSAPTLAEVEAA